MGDIPAFERTPGLRWRNALSGGSHGFWRQPQSAVEVVRASMSPCARRRGPRRAPQSAWPDALLATFSCCLAWRPGVWALLWRLLSLRRTGWMPQTWPRWRGWQEPAPLPTSGGSIAGRLADEGFEPLL